MYTTFLLTPYLNPTFRKRSKSRKISLLPSSLLLNLHLMIEYKGKAPVNTRLNPIGPLEGKLSLAYYNSFVWATLVASGSVWVGRLKSPLAVKGLIRYIDFSLFLNFFFYFVAKFKVIANCLRNACATL